MNDDNTHEIDDNDNGKNDEQISIRKVMHMTQGMTMVQLMKTLIIKNKMRMMRI